MRIIVTSNGKEFLNKIHSSNSCPVIFNNNQTSNIRNDNPLISNNQQNYNNFINQQNNINDNLNNINDDSKIPIKSNSNLIASNNNFRLISPKILKIRERNYKIPKSFIKKYESKENQINQGETPIIQQSLSILSALDNNNNKFNSSNNSVIEEAIPNSRFNSGISRGGDFSVFLPKIKSHYSLGEIINKNCFDKLNKNIKERLQEKERNLSIGNKILRKNWSSFNIYDEINKRKNKTIDIKNYKLIEYLMKKTTISGDFLKKLNDCNDEKFMHLNKISDKILMEKEKQKNYNKRIKEKLEQQKVKESEQFRKILLKIKNNVNNNIKDNHMNKYLLVKDSNKVVYKNVFRKFREKYWKKSNNFSRFFPKYQNVHYEEI